MNKIYGVRIRRDLIRKFLFLEQNSLYYYQKPRKAVALLHFWLQFKQFCISTKLRSTLKCEIVPQVHILKKNCLTGLGVIPAPFFFALIANFIQFFRHILLFSFCREKVIMKMRKHKGVQDMTPKQKILAIRLSEKLSKNPDYSKYLGIEIKKTKRTKKEVLQNCLK